MTTISNPPDYTIDPPLIYDNEKCAEAIALAKTQLIDKCEVLAQKLVFGSDICCENASEVIKLHAAIEIYEENDIAIDPDGTLGYTTYPTVRQRELTTCVCKFLNFKSK